MPDPINVEAQDTPRGLVVRIAGDAAVGQIDELDRQLHVLTALAPKIVVIDLSGLTYISSMGIGSLLRFRNDIVRAGGKIAVAAPQTQVAEAFRMARLEQVLPVHASIDAALAS